MPVSCGKWLSTGLPKLKSDLEARLVALRTELAEAETEKAAWIRLQGTPGVHDATKNRYITANANEWAETVKKLKDELVILETDIKSLTLIG